MTDIVVRLNGSLSVGYSELRKEAAATITRLRAKIKQMERQEPVAWRTFDGEGGYDYRSFADNEDYQVSWEARNPNHKGWVEPLYLTSGAQAQSAPSVLVDLTPLESVQYWADAYGNSMGDEHFLGHGVAARLLREYVNLRAMLAAAPEAKP